LFCGTTPNKAGAAIPARGELETMGAHPHLYLFMTENYDARLLPAYRMFLEKRDPQPLIQLLMEVRDDLGTNSELPGPGFDERRSYEEDISILKGTLHDPEDLQGPESETRDYARQRIFPKLLKARCVPSNLSVDPDLDMERIGSYLSERSEWIQGVLAGVDDSENNTLEILMGDSYPRVLSRREIQVFAAELERIPPPQTGDTRERVARSWDRFRDEARRQFPEGASRLQLLETIDFLERQSLLASNSGDIGLRSDYSKLAVLLSTALADSDLSLLLTRE
jgi:hypothetical protein